MSRWFKIAAPMGVAAVLVAVLAVGFGSPSSQAAKGGNAASPTLTVTGGGEVIGQADVGEGVVVTGQGFPRNTAVFVVITNMPSLLVQSDDSGSFQTSAVFSEAGSYVFSACFYVKAQGGRWDCNSTAPVTLDVVH